VILAVVMGLSGLSPEVAHALVARDVPKILARHYRAMQYPVHRVLSLRILRNLFLWLPAASGWLIGSSLLQPLVDDLPGEIYQVKKETLLLLCAFSQSTEVYTQCFLENHFVAVYIDGLDLESRRVRVAVIESIAMLLKHAIMCGDEGTRGALLEAFETVELLDVLENVAADGADGQLCEKVDVLNRLIKGE
jgi:hypothetical protein